MLSSFPFRVSSAIVSEPPENENPGRVFSAAGRGRLFILPVYFLDQRPDGSRISEL